MTRQDGTRRPLAVVRETAGTVVIALALALLVKTFLVQAFFIPSGSMERTLHGCPGCTGDRVLVNKVVHSLRDVRRGEIVVFNGAGSWGRNADVVAPPPPGVAEEALRGLARTVGAGPPGADDYVKRVVGLPGDRVACCGPTGRVTVQPAGADRPVELDEPYVFEDDSRPFCAAGRDTDDCPVGAPGVLVPEGRLFVLGDHRSHSGDSRAHLDDGANGTIPVDDVVGRAFVVVWPVGRATLLGIPDVLPAS